MSDKAKQTFGEVMGIRCAVTKVEEPKEAITNGKTPDDRAVAAGPDVITFMHRG